MSRAAPEPTPPAAGDGSELLSPPVPAAEARRARLVRQCAATGRLDLRGEEGAGLGEEGLAPLLRACAGRVELVFYDAPPRDGRLLSGSSDKTLRLWDAGGAECVGTLEGHTGWVMCCAELRAGADAVPSFYPSPPNSLRAASGCV